ncbi:MAG: RdgB/HAM1 family non-canonical purine NTP pyrophosphatase [Bacteroidales bacterium]|nr:RdgB/HAM1 family non-canonical purine NTP pyrophosphatase [Bacteroidales bacterium]
MEIVFATHNQHKTEEGRAILGADYRILNLPELGCPDIPETADTLKGNALQKAQYVADHYGRNCFADDTGLEVLALDGRPGVYSARYAGEGCSYQDNVLKLLGEMQGAADRRACFKTVVALILNGETYFFEGRVDGIILPEQRGTDGFGYDPVFLPDGYDQTFAEMSPATKNSISHRGRAIQQLAAFLKNCGN